MKAAFARLRAAAPDFLRDVMGGIGGALTSYGAWRIYEPAGFIVAGTLLIACCWLLARKDS